MQNFSALTSIEITKKSCMRFHAIILIIGFFLTAKSISSASTLTGNIQINGRQLLVNGVPFIMKGICYSPVSKGKMYPDGLITLNPTPDDLVTIEHDFQMMHAAGINTIRTYIPMVAPGILTLLAKYQLRTIIPICPSLDCYQNLDTIAQTVELLKNDTSTLLWEIGNEWNFNHFYTYTYGDSSSSTDQNTANLSSQQCLDLIKTVTTLIKQHDTTHPISSNVSCPAVKKVPPSVYPELPDCVDLVGINVYHGLNFGPGFSNWNQLTDKPFYIGETGAVAWNANINAKDEKAQAVGVHALATEIMTHLSAIDSYNILVGGCIFEWCNEWWKQGFPLLHDVGGVRLEKDGPYPANRYDDEWFGILTINRKPRDAYYALQKVFTKRL